MDLSSLLKAIKPIVQSWFPRWVYPNDNAWVGTAGAPLTSTSWDGDAFSTVSKTLIDLSAVFSVPAGVKAVKILCIVRDSGSAATATCGVRFSPNNTASSSEVTIFCGGLANDSYAAGSGQVTCDANGDIYYQTTASGTGTLDIILQISGYLL